jgi:hypothetical protein
MTTEEMIKVMQHYVDGGEVVFTHRGELGTWEVFPKQYIYWNWDEYNYRIKPEPEKTKTMWFWIVKTKSGVFFTNQMYTEEKIRKLWPKALEFKRVDMLGSEEVEV